MLRTTERNGRRASGAPASRAPASRAPANRHPKRPAVDEHVARGATYTCASRDEIAAGASPRRSLPAHLGGAASSPGQPGRLSGKSAASWPGRAHNIMCIHTSGEKTHVARGPLRKPPNTKDL